MVAIILDENNYIKSYSNKFRKPESVLVAAIPDESDPEKLRCYQYTDDAFVFDAEKWAAIEAERAAMAAEIAAEEKTAVIMNKIDNLKGMIESSDYQIIKCYEYSLLKLAMPYDIETLHAERQAIRDQINELQKTL